MKFALLLCCLLTGCKSMSQFPDLWPEFVSGEFVSAGGGLNIPAQLFDIPINVSLPSRRLYVYFWNNNTIGAVNITIQIMYEQTVLVSFPILTVAGTKSLYFPSGNIIGNANAVTNGNQSDSCPQNSITFYPSPGALISNEPGVSVLAPFNLNITATRIRVVSSGIAFFASARLWIGCYSETP